MTKDELSKIKEHIEIHARREHGAVKITEILWKAVDELEHVEEENERLKQQIMLLKLDKLEEEQQYETCPYRSTDMGCDYCDYRDRDLKDEVTDSDENFDLNKVLTCVTANEAQVGMKGYFADSLDELKFNFDADLLYDLSKICCENYAFRFENGKGSYALFYPRYGKLK